MKITLLIGFLIISRKKTKKYKELDQHYLVKEDFVIYPTRYNDFTILYYTMVPLL